MNIIKFITNWKYRYLYKKIEAIEKVIVDYELSRFKTREKREEFREVYDNLRAKLHTLEEHIKTAKAEELVKLNESKAALEKEIENNKSWMEGLDLEVEGTKPTAKYPEGVEGIEQKLEKLRELILIIRDYIRLV